MNPGEDIKDYFGLRSYLEPGDFVALLEDEVARLKHQWEGMRGISIESDERWRKRIERIEGLIAEACLLYDFEDKE